MDSTQRSKLYNPEIGRNKIPFKSNTGVRIGFGIITVMLMIFLACIVGTTSTITSKIFYASTPDESLENSDKKEYDRANKASIGLSVSGLLLVIGLIVCFFMVPGGVKYSLDYSTRLAEDLALVTQGPERLRRASGLLSYYLYPKGDKDEGKRASAANDILNNLRTSYEERLQSEGGTIKKPEYLTQKDFVSKLNLNR